jgi:hypothetical protein
MPVTLAAIEDARCRIAGSALRTQLGVPRTVVLPDTAPAVKLEAVKRLGARGPGLLRALVAAHVASEAIDPRTTGRGAPPQLDVAVLRRGIDPESLRSVLLPRKGATAPCSWWLANAASPVVESPQFSSPSE